MSDDWYNSIYNFANPTYQNNPAYFYDWYECLWRENEPTPDHLASDTWTFQNPNIGNSPNIPILDISRNSTNFNKDDAEKFNDDFLNVPIDDNFKNNFVQQYINDNDFNFCTPNEIYQLVPPIDKFQETINAVVRDNTQISLNDSDIQFIIQYEHAEHIKKVDYFMKSILRNFKEKYYNPYKKEEDVFLEFISRYKTITECVEIYNLPKWAENFMSLSDEDLRLKLLTEDNLTHSQWHMLAKLRSRKIKSTREPAKKNRINSFPLNFYRMASKDIYDKFLKNDYPDITWDYLTKTKILPQYNRIRAMKDKYSQKIARFIRQREKKRRYYDAKQYCDDLCIF